MKATSLSDRLLEAIVTAKQDAQASGTDDTPRVRQRIEAMVDAHAVVELAELQSAALAFAGTFAATRRPIRFREWFARRKAPSDG